MSRLTRCLTRWLFPAEPRDFAGRRWLKIALRAAHVLAAGVLVGAHVLDADPSACQSWLRWVIASGVALLLLDLHETAAFLVQVRGLFVVTKIGLVVALPWLGSTAAWVLAGVLLTSVVFSHAPSRVRYHVVLGRGKVAASHSRG